MLGCACKALLSPTPGNKAIQTVLVQTLIFKGGDSTLKLQAKGGHLYYRGGQHPLKNAYREHCALLSPHPSPLALPFVLVLCPLSFGIVARSSVVRR